MTEAWASLSLLDFPPMAGLFVAIVGGIIVSQTSGSFVTINCPAAGLIVVVVNCVKNLGRL